MQVFTGLKYFHLIQNFFALAGSHAVVPLFVGLLQKFFRMWNASESTDKLSRNSILQEPQWTTQKHQLTIHSLV